MDILSIIILTFLLGIVIGSFTTYKFLKPVIHEKPGDCLRAMNPKCTNNSK
jgi:uncharacterized protein YneF (UPF0154 family)